MIKIEIKGSTRSTEDFLNRMKNRQQFKVLEKYGPMGVTALAHATPKDHADTANAWYYEIVSKPGYFGIHWYNSHRDDDGRAPVAVLLQYGHATRQGGYVQAQDYINPALKPIFDQIAADMWKEVTR